jgi:outer membrane lipoprotein SlyB
VKKFYAISYCFLIFFAASAQSDTAISSSLSFVPKSQLKATVYLKNNAKTTGIITQITDSTIVLLQSLPKENSITYANSIIKIQEIKIIKIKKHAFFLGMASGAMATGFLGYGLGRGSYADNPLLSDDENNNKAEMEGYKGAVIGAVPGAVMGSIIGSMVVKRKFIINGDIKKVKAMVKRLWGKKKS